MDKKIKRFLKIREKNSLFFSLNTTIHFIDGSEVTTDLLYYDDFKKFVDKEITGTEFREPKKEDYKEELDNILYLFNNINESNYFKVMIKGEEKTFTPDRILKIDVHLKK